MNITFVRHAQPAWGIGGIAQPDPALTDLGSEQARLTSGRLAETHRDRDVELIVSPAVRARATAAPIAEALGVDPQVVPGLVEIGMPDWEGTPTEAVAALFQQAYQREPADWWDGMPGGETFRDFHSRVTDAILELLAARGATPHGGHPEDRLWAIDQPGRSVIVVAHHGVNAVALSFLLGAEPTPWEWERFVLGHASLARLSTFPIGSAYIFSMRSFNDVEHLATGQRTR